MRNIPNKIRNETLDTEWKSKYQQKLKLKQNY